MNDKFDELTKAMAQSVTRRGVLKKFGVGLAGVALAWLGLANKAHAHPAGSKGHGNCNNCTGAPYYGCAPNDLACMKKCQQQCCYLCGAH